MKHRHPIDEFSQRLRDQITRGFPADEATFNRLALELFVLQFAHNPSFRKLGIHRGLTPEKVAEWREIPAVPTSAFKEFELTSLAPGERSVVFHSSGTTGQRPSRHFHNAGSLAVYEASLLPWFQRHVAPDGTKLCMLSLTPQPEAAPHSSLAHMMATVLRTFGSPDSEFVGAVDAAGAWSSDAARAVEFLRRWGEARQPVVILGTAFSFVHLLDFVAEVGPTIRLPAGSCVMETGGYKGRSRELPKSELHRLIMERLGVPASHIICEYGMSELSSQAYDGEARFAGPSRTVQCGVRNRERFYRFPPWTRVQIISPETGREVGEGEAGLIRILDLANVRSVLAVLTEDFGVRRGAGFELIGRAALAEARGCSLMAT